MLVFLTRVASSAAAILTSLGPVHDATWEPSEYLGDYGAFGLVAKYNGKLTAEGHRQPGGKPTGKRKGSVRYAGASRAAATIVDEDLHTVMEVMVKRKLEGSIAQHREVRMSVDCSRRPRSC